MARPRKADGDKLIIVSTGLTAARVARLKRLAESRDVPLAVVLREFLDPAFRAVKNTSASITV